jgi:hypothetical protein
MIPDSHRRALRILLATLPTDAITWALTGSLSFALQGVPVEPHDIDIQTDEAGAYAVARCFADSLTRPVQFSATARIRSHFGAFTLERITVEVMGALQKRLPDGSWEPPVEVTLYRRWVAFEAWRIPVLDLAYEQQAYLVMGRAERAALLAEFLARQAGLEPLE